VRLQQDGVRQRPERERVVRGALWGDAEAAVARAASQFGSPGTATSPAMLARRSRTSGSPSPAIDRTLSIGFLLRVVSQGIVRYRPLRRIGR
jgi:hypothetical protein